MSIENIKRVMDQALEGDLDIALESWWKYKALTTEIAWRHKFPAHIGAAVFAALSPNNDYYGNLRDTDRLLAAARAGLTIDQFKVSTYGNNKRKAWAIAQGTDPLTLIVFKKIRNFYLNVRDPDDPVPVTVDGHVHNIWTGKRIRLTEAAQKLKPQLYDVIAEDIRAVAAETKMLPNQVQAIIWTVWRRIHNIRASTQAGLWDLEALAANLGFRAYVVTAYGNDYARWRDQASALLPDPQCEFQLGAGNGHHSGRERERPCLAGAGERAQRGDSDLPGGNGAPGLPSSQ